jgi:hypothetical protein
VGGAARHADALAKGGLADAAGAWARRECLVPAGLSREDRLIDHQGGQRTGAEASVHSARQAGEPKLEGPRVTADMLEDVEVRRGTGGSELEAANDIFQPVERAKLQVALSVFSTFGTR